MSDAKPLTREERDRVQAVIIYWNDEPQPDEEFNYDRMSARYEATVRAAEDRIEELRTVMERHRDCCPPWIGELLDTDARMQASGDYSVTRTPESAGDE